VKGEREEGSAAESAGFCVDSAWKFAEVSETPFWTENRTVRIRGIAATPDGNPQFS
jgi:hypothetical protein